MHRHSLPDLDVSERNSPYETAARSTWVNVPAHRPRPARMRLSASATPRRSGGSDWAPVGGPDGPPRGPSHVDSRRPSPNSPSPSDHGSTPPVRRPCVNATGQAPAYHSSSGPPAPTLGHRTFTTVNRFPGPSSDRPSAGDQSLTVCNVNGSAAETTIDAPHQAGRQRCHVPGPARQPSELMSDCICRRRAN